MLASVRHWGGVARLALRGATMNTESQFRQKRWCVNMARWCAALVIMVSVVAQAQMPSPSASAFVRSCVFEHGQAQSVCEALEPPRPPLLQQCWEAAGESRWQCLTITQRVQAVSRHQQATSAILADMDQRYPAIAARDARHCAPMAQALVCVITQRPREHRWFFGKPGEPTAPAAAYLAPGSEIDSVWYSARHDRLVVRARREDRGELVVFRPVSGAAMNLAPVVSVHCPAGLRPDAGSRVLAHPHAQPTALACDLVGG